jgi:hypothetical protein
MVAEPVDLVVAHLRILSLGPDALAFNAFLEKIGGSLEHLEPPGCIGGGQELVHQVSFNSSIMCGLRTEMLLLQMFRFRFADAPL